MHPEVMSDVGLSFQGFLSHATASAELPPELGPSISPISHTLFQAEFGAMTMWMCGELGVPY